MAYKIPKPELLMTYSDIADRFDLLRPVFFEALGEDAGFQRFCQPGVFDLPGEFRRNMDLRESCVEVLLASILWLEARRPLAEILQHCAPEITRHLVYTANVFLDFVRLRSAAQRETIVSLGSSATAWIHLFAEFRDELTRQHGTCWWKTTPRTYPS